MNTDLFLFISWLVISLVICCCRGVKVMNSEGWIWHINQDCNSWAVLLSGLLDEAKKLHSLLDELENCIWSFVWGEKTGPFKELENWYIGWGEKLCSSFGEGNIGAPCTVTICMLLTKVFCTKTVQPLGLQKEVRTGFSCLDGAGCFDQLDRTSCFDQLDWTSCFDQLDQAGRFDRLDRAGCFDQLDGAVCFD